MLLGPAYMAQLVSRSGPGQERIKLQYMHY